MELEDFGTLGSRKRSEKVEEATGLTRHMFFSTVGPFYFVLEKKEADLVLPGKNISWPESVCNTSKPTYIFFL